ncbi:hypothetical protein [Hymenobacter sp. BT730]|uniref:hypothetical protein n=1 Tax=Hymenobacter sp. BT730 TaxID=3063332 RepID=UPI0026DF2D1E|nr:hypothetical protein [Hymenobacter sp. BT730]
MTPFLRWSLLATVSILSLSACKKEEPTRAELLMGPKWLTTAFYTERKGQDNYDLLGVGTCYSDDFKVYTTGKYTRDEGAIKCDPSYPQVTAGTWQLTENETKFTIREVGWAESETWTLVEITSSTMTIEKPSANPDAKFVRKFKAI